MLRKKKLSQKALLSENKGHVENFFLEKLVKYLFLDKNTHFPKKNLILKMHFSKL